MNSLRGRSDRGQAWTFDALLMLALMVGGIVYAMQLLPLYEDRTLSEEFIEAQVQQDASDLLAVAAATGELLNATVYWNDTSGQWADAGPDGVYTRAPDGHPLGVPLSSVFDSESIGYNIDVEYQTTDGGTAVHRMYYQGTPGAHGVSVSSTIVLYDDTYLSYTRNKIKLDETTNFYAPDVFLDSPKYNVFRIRIIAWKL